MGPQVLADGSETELQATGEARAQFSAVPSFMVHTLEVSRSMLKQLRDGDDTGIRGFWFRVLGSGFRV